MAKRCGPNRSICGMSQGIYNPFFQNGAQWYGAGGGVEPEPAHVEMNVSNFLASSSQYAVSAARLSTLEINSGSGDQARTYFGWFKADNFNHATGRLLSISNASRDQVSVLLTGADNTTRPYKLIINILGNVGATAFLELESSAKILRNRWVPFAVCYSGNASHTGLSLFIGSGADSSPIRSTTGSYTSAYQDANMRFSLGASIQASPAYFGGQQLYTGVMNRVMTSGEFAEFRNGGIPASPGSMSFSSAIIDFWSLTSNVTSNGGTALTNNGVTFKSSKVGQDYNALSFKKVTTNNTAYQAFGNWAAKGIGFWRQGTGHVPEGDLLRVVQDMDNFTAAQSGETGGPSVTVVINEPATAHVSGVSAIQMLTKLYVFYATYNDSGSAFVDLGRRESTDGLTGTTWSARTTMTNTYPRFEFYGRPINISGSIWLVAQFEHNNGVEYRVSVWKTTDDGASFNKITVFEDTTFKLGEPAIVSSGNTVVMIARAEGAGDGMYQLLSTNAGDTWGSPVKINLGTGESNAALTKDSQGRIVMVYMDRSQKFLRMSRGNEFATIMANPTGWNAAENIFRGANADSGYNLLGYADIMHLGNELYQVSVSTEYSGTKADLQIAHGRLFNLS